MKRLKFIPIVLSFSIGLYSCGSEIPPEPVRLSSEFKTELSYTQSGRDFKADLSRFKNGSWELTYTEPETIEGLTFTQTDEVITVSFGDLNYLADPSQLNDTSAVRLINSAADKLVSGKGLKAESLKKGVTTMTGTLDGQDLRACIKKGKLLSLEIGEELSVKFS